MSILSLIAAMFISAAFVSPPSTFLLEQKEKEEAVGSVLRIRGPVYLKKGISGKEITLDAKRDLKRDLHADERLRCGKGGSARIQVYGNISELNSANGWFVIPRVSTTNVINDRDAGSGGRTAMKKLKKRSYVGSGGYAEPARSKIRTARKRSP